MPNAADWGGGVFYQSGEYACMLHVISLRAHFSQNVKYWYVIRDIFFTLVPIFHGVKCENLRFGTAYGISSLKLTYTYYTFNFCFLVIKSAITAQ